MALKYSEYSSDFFKKQIFPSFINNSRISSKTGKEYCSLVRYICDFLQKDFVDITEEEAFRYYKHVKGKYENGKLTAKTFRNRILTLSTLTKHIQQYFPELLLRNYYDSFPQVAVSDKIPVSTMPSMEELDHILKTAKEVDYQAFVILILASRVALTASTIVALRKDAFHVTKDRLFLERPCRYQSEEPVWLPLSKDVSELLTHYMEYYTGNDNLLFKNRFGNPMTLRNMDAAIRKIIKAAGITEHYTLKDLRSRAILEMISTNVNTEEIQQYVNISGQRMRHFLSTGNILTTCPEELVPRSSKQRSLV